MFREGSVSNYHMIDIINKVNFKVPLINVILPLVMEKKLFLFLVIDLFCSSNFVLTWKLFTSLA